MKILVVDDEKISRTILTAKLNHMGTCVAVDSSARALEIMAAAQKEGSPFDLITLDVSMPGMDGRHMLQHVRKQEIQANIPKADRVKILMVTARMNMNTIKDCIRLGCNGYLVKPVTRYQLLQNLGKMGFETKASVASTEADQIQTVAVADVINRFYSGKIDLPVFPRVVQEAQSLLNQEPPPAMEAVAGVVEKDIVISSKLISVANSPLYKGMDTVSTLNAAVLRLGLKITQGTITAVAAKHLFDADKQSLKKELDRLWLHSFAVAFLGRQIAKALGNKEAEDIFLMGIIHDIGKMLIMKVFSDRYPNQSVSDKRFQLAVHEIHTTFGAALLKKMRFSKPFVHVAEFHHWNAFGKGEDPGLLIVNLADHLSYEIGFGYLAEQVPENMRNAGAGKTDFSQAAKAAQKKKDEEAGIDSDLALGLHDRQGAVKRLSSLPCLALLGLEAEAVLAIAEQIQPSIQESARAF